MNARSNSFRSTRLGPALALLLGSSALAPTFAQGRDNYFNVESIQCSPITTATVNGHTYILACNTPDNSLEIWDTDETLPASQRFLRRIPVGLEPVSVIWDSQRSRFTVACFLSDSLANGTITATGGASTLVASVNRIENVGDEPIDLALTPDNSAILVTFKGASSIGAFYPITLAPIASTAALPPPTDNLLLEQTVGADTRVIKEPHAVVTRGDQVFVLGFKGGTGNPVFIGSDYDFDLYSRNLVTGDVEGIGGLGSTNWNMAFDSGGDLYVVGGMAQNQLTGSAVATATGGFVTSNLYRVTGAGTGSPVVIDRNINQDSGGVEVLSTEALTMPTDVVVYEPSVGPAKVFLAAFGSDKVGSFGNTVATNSLSWTRTEIDIDPAVGSTSARSGPRGLALKLATSDSLDPGDRLYVLNRLDNSISIVDPVTDSFVETMKLNADPTPDHIVAGREFLYSADLSDSGFVSCASCHMDGRTDSLAWDLGEPGGFTTTFGRDFIDSPSLTTLAELIALIAVGEFDPDKGEMVTQSLQGLLNFDVAPASQDAVTNAPYHWRGDRADFTAFNEGFAGLLQMGNLFGTPQAPAGIPAADMLAFEQFVNSISYPPNPKQHESRTYSGSVGNDINDLTKGSRALRGMKAFHMQRLPGPGTSGRSCVQCHSLPSGSNSKYTNSTSAADPETIESAQLRGLFQREPVFQVDGNDNAAPFKESGAFGLAHTGGRGSINQFVSLFAGAGQLGANGDNVDEVSQYLHEFDFGSAPMIGQLITVRSTTTGPGDSRMATFEGQADLANVGIAVIGQVNGVPLDYWYDPVSGLYVQDSTGASIGRAALLAQVAGPRDRLFAICTPLGSSRRVAHIMGSPAALTGPAPSSLDLEPLATNTANTLIPQMLVNWIPGTLLRDFSWTHTDPNMPTPRFPRSIRQFQYGLIQAVDNYGITGLRHDAPRRLRVSGNNILEGAKLHIYSPADTTGAAPDTANPPDPMKVTQLTFDLFPTNSVGEAPIWETAAELAPITYYTLMNGGTEAPLVRAILDDVLSALPEPPAVGTLDPDSFNFHFIEVENPDGTTTAGGWHALTLAP